MVTRAKVVGGVKGKAQSWVAEESLNVEMMLSECSKYGAKWGLGVGGT